MHARFLLSPAKFSNVFFVVMTALQMANNRFEGTLPLAWSSHKVILTLSL